MGERKNYLPSDFSDAKFHLWNTEVTKEIYLKNLMVFLVTLITILQFNQKCKLHVCWKMHVCSIPPPIHYFSNSSYD